LYHTTGLHNSLDYGWTWTRNPTQTYIRQHIEASGRMWVGFRVNIQLRKIGYEQLYTGDCGFLFFFFFFVTGTGRTIIKCKLIFFFLSLSLSILVSTILGRDQITPVKYLSNVTPLHNALTNSNFIKFTFKLKVSYKSFMLNFTKI
jgi:hypothetical protein